MTGFCWPDGPSPAPVAAHGGSPPRLISSLGSCHARASLRPEPARTADAPEGKPSGLSEPTSSPSRHGDLWRPLARGRHSHAPRSVSGRGDLIGGYARRAAQSSSPTASRGIPRTLRNASGIDDRSDASSRSRSLGTSDVFPRPVTSLAPPRLYPDRHLLGNRPITGSLATVNRQPAIPQGRNGPEVGGAHPARPGSHPLPVRPSRPRATPQTVYGQQSGQAEDLCPP
jgi:hypothetical protein